MRKTIFIFSLLALITLTGASCVTLGGSKTNAGVMGVFRSEDKGDTWKAAMTYPSVKGVQSISSINTYKMYTDPSDKNAIYLTTRGQGLYYSYNNGDSWQSVAFMSKKFLYGLAVDPNDKCTIYAADASFIYKTEDCSRTWKTVYHEERTNQRFAGVALDYKDPKILYAGQLGGAVLISKDSGKSWQVIKRLGVNIRDIITDPQVPNRVYVASYRNGLYVSDDQGKEWRNVSKGFSEFSGSKEFYRLVLNPGKKDSLFWISKYGILRTDDVGETWTALKLITPPGSVNIYSFAINPDNQKEIYYTGTILGKENVHVRSTFYKSNDGGENWVTKKMPTTSIPSQMLLNPSNTKMLLMSFMKLSQ